MLRDEVASYLAVLSPAVRPVEAWGEIAYFYNREDRLPRGVYFATLKSKDGDNDRASRLDRSGVYRLNVGIGKAGYRSLFGAPPARPVAGGVVETGHDFTTLDVLLPHPVYAWMCWICVLTPSSATFDTIKPLLDDAHQIAALKFEKRIKS